MAEREDLIGNLRQLLELDRGMGLEWIARGGATSVPPGAVLAPVPVAAAAPPVKPAAVAPAPVAPVIAEPPKVAARVAEPLPAPVLAAPVVPLPPVVARVPQVAAPVAEQSADNQPLAAAALAAVAAEVARCTACGLCATRRTTVPGEGSPSAELVFVGEGPGADEDAQGRPFVGRAGELLTKMIEAMGLTREQVYICNVVKCRPPENRTPLPDEIAACSDYLVRQLTTIKPKIICALGNTPLRALMQDDRLGITRMRGKLLEWRGIPLIPTYHPAYLLRNPEMKKPCWEDLKQVLGMLGKVPPARK